MLDDERWPIWLPSKGEVTVLAVVYFLAGTGIALHMLFSYVSVLGIVTVVSSMFATLLLLWIAKSGFRTSEEVNDLLAKVDYQKRRCQNDKREYKVSFSFRSSR